jgi:hypothetical protein
MNMPCSLSFSLQEKEQERAPCPINCFIVLTMQPNILFLLMVTGYLPWSFT